MKSVVANFVGTARDYEYFAPKGDTPQVGDLIITSIAPIEAAPARYSGDKLANVARISKVNDVPTGHAKKFYLQLLSREDMQSRELENRELLEQEQRKLSARAALERKLAARDKMGEFEKLSLEDPEAAELLKILKG